MELKPRFNGRNGPFLSYQWVTRPRKAPAYGVTGLKMENIMHLSRREKQVLIRVRAGLNLTEAARCLGINKLNARTIAANARAKLGVTSTKEAAIAADLLGVLEDPTDVNHRVTVEVHPEDVKALHQYVAHLWERRRAPAEFKLPEHIAHDQSWLRRAEK